MKNPFGSRPRKTFGTDPQTLDLNMKEKIHQELRELEDYYLESVKMPFEDTAHALRSLTSYFSVPTEEIVQLLGADTIKAIDKLLTTSGLEAQHKMSPWRHPQYHQRST